jgi:hypothetical protein
MGSPGDGDHAGGEASSGFPWLSDYLARTSHFWEEGARSSAAIASKWGERSLRDDEWTIDTVTADLIEAWEELTPMVGEGLDLWLELVQQSLGAKRSDG